MRKLLKHDRIQTLFIYLCKKKRDKGAATKQYTRPVSTKYVEMSLRQQVTRRPRLNSVIYFLQILFDFFTGN